jgi:NAD(P)H-hydrate epimerase
MQNSPHLWLKEFPFPKREGHKYYRGHALVYGGAVMTGAARLAARAAQRSGAGLVSIATTKEAVPIYAKALESIIVNETSDVIAWRKLLAGPKHNTILVGPGMGLGPAYADMVLAALETGKPCVLDADALTNFAETPEKLFDKLHADCILTPHEGEFNGLFGKKIDPQKPKAERTVAAAKLARCTVLLKGADTIIALPDGRRITNNNAPPWLATAGAGDVLAGIVLGLITQKMQIFWAAAAAAWIHGEAANNFGLGMIAEDLVEGIPKALQTLKPE